MDKPGRQIVGLDLVRFTAACLVVMHHLGFWIWANAAQSQASGLNALSYRWLGPFAAPGWIGVEIFFVLSGFVIAYSAQKGSALDFVRSRVVRLYPGAWVCSSLTVLACLLLASDSLRSLLRPWMASALLLPRSTWVDSVYWTLGLEMVFYGIVLALLLMHRLRWLGAVMSVLGLVCSALWAFSFFVERGWLAGPTARHLAHQFLFGRLATVLLLQHGCFFAIGVLLWLCLLRRPTGPRIVALAICCVGGALEIRTHAASLQVMTGLQTFCVRIRRSAGPLAPEPGADRACGAVEWTPAGRAPHTRKPDRAQTRPDDVPPVPASPARRCPADRALAYPPAGSPVATAGGAAGRGSKLRGQPVGRTSPAARPSPHAPRQGAGSTGRYCAMSGAATARSASNSLR